MPANRPNPRPWQEWLPAARRAALLSLVLLITGMLLIPAVSATNAIVLTDVQNEHFSYFISAGITNNPYSSTGFRMSFLQIEKFPKLKVLYVNTAASISDLESWEECEGRLYPVTFVSESSGNIVGYGNIAYNLIYNSAGSVTHIQWWIETDSWDITGLTGTRVVAVNYDADSPLKSLIGTVKNSEQGISTERPVAFFTGVTGIPGDYIARSEFIWSNTIDYDENYVYVTRNNQFSNVTIQSPGGGFTDSGYDDDKYFHILPSTWQIINGRGMIYNGTFTGESAPPSSSAILHLYVKSSQTNALISNADVLISAGFNDPTELLEVANETLASGTKTYTLQPTGGGLPNPDFYRVMVAADGYNAEMPYADIELEAGVSMTLIVGMEPTSGGPIDPEKTYIEFYVRDINANPIPNAVVKCGAYTLMTNSAGFTQFDLPKNATYSYTVRKTGYTTIEGTVTVGAASRYPVNVVLGAGTIPTITPGPTDPGATPTPDRRTNQEKGQSIIDMIADNAEPLAALALLGTFLGLFKLMAKW